MCSRWTWSQFHEGLALFVGLRMSGFDCCIFVLQWRSCPRELSSFCQSEAPVKGKQLLASNGGCTTVGGSSHNVLPGVAYRAWGHDSREDARSRHGRRFAPFCRPSGGLTRSSQRLAPYPTLQSPSTAELEAELRKAACTWSDRFWSLNLPYPTLASRPRSSLTVCCWVQNPLLTRYVAPCNNGDNQKSLGIVLRLFMMFMFFTSNQGILPDCGIVPLLHIVPPQCVSRCFRAFPHRSNSGQLRPQKLAFLNFSQVVL